MNIMLMINIDVLCLFCRHEVYNLYEGLMASNVKNIERASYMNLWIVLFSMTCVNNL